MAIQTTLAEFEHFINLAENQDRLFELIQGKLVEKMPKCEHGIIAANIATDINIYLRKNRIGHVAVEARYRVYDDPQNSLLPDVSFVLNRDEPVERQGAALYMPDLAIEIKSPNDTFKQLREKAQYYLKHGTQMIWLVFPEQKVVEVYTRDDEWVVGENESLTGGAVLPDFTLSVSSIFDYP